MSTTISHSRVDSYLACRRKDYYGYTLRLERVRENSSTSLGTAIHRVLAAFYSAAMQGEDFDSCLDSAYTMLLFLKEEGFEGPENRQDIEVVLKFYFDDEPFISKGYKVLGVEEEFNLAWEGGEYPFVVDLILQDPKGYVVVVDHKSAVRFNYYDDTDLMPQIPKYIGAMRALGRKAHYGLYNLLRTEKILGAKMNKAELVETLNDYFADLDGEGHPDFAKMTVPVLAEIAEEKGISIYAGPTQEQMHKVVEVRPNASRINRTFMEQLGVASEIAARDLLPVEEIESTAWRTMNQKTCDGCWFNDLCNEELRGGNVKILLATEFRERDKREPIPVTEEIE